MSNLISWLIFLPSFTAAFLLLIPKSWAKHAWTIGLGSSLVSLALLGKAWVSFDPEVKGLQLQVNVPWFIELGSRYHIGFDGISLVMGLLVSVVSVLIFLGARSFTCLPAAKEKVFVALLLALQTGAIGAFAAADLVIFFMFFEFVLIPSYFLVGMFGGKDRIRAGVRFFIYTALGSLFMLFAIAWLIGEHGRQFGMLSASYADIARLTLDFSDSTLGAALGSTQGLVFLAFMLAFFVKSPLIPFHGWLLKTYEEAPTAGTVFIAAVLGKMGTYGLVRFLGFFPAAFAYFHVFFMWVSGIGILFGAFQALKSKSMKALIAWSSLSHVSYILLGIFSGGEEAASGAVLQMFNHGILIAGLFLVAGYLDARRPDGTILDFGGFAKKTPILAVFFMILVLGSIGLPGTSGFVGEFLILAGAFKSHMLIGALATTGMVFGAMYMLSFYQKTMFGKASFLGETKDIGAGDMMALTLAVWLVFQVGLHPQSFIGPIKTSPSIQIDKEP
jgi:NADH-quinone oxidoreductase subunit M